MPIRDEYISYVGHEQPDLERHDGGWRITVSDQGPGIPPALANTAFERFARGPNPRAPGAGLGLSIVESFVHLHKGDVKIDTQPGKGTIVTCRIPSAATLRSVAAE